MSVFEIWDMSCLERDKMQQKTARAMKNFGRGRKTVLCCGKRETYQPCRTAFK